MHQSFKRSMILLINDSWLCCLLVIYIAGLLMFWPVALIALIALLILEPIRSQAFLPGTMDISPNFYAYRTWGGYWYITQRKTLLQENCRVKQRAFLQDSKIVKKGLSAGIYRMVTHSVVLKEVTKIPNVKILALQEAYTSDLKSILSAMTNRKCKKCKKRCMAYRAKPRKFYKVKFQVKS